MGRQRGVAAAVVIPMLLFLLASTIAASSEGVTDDVEKSRPGLLVEALLDHLSLLQLASHAPDDKLGRDQQSPVIDLLNSDARPAVLDESSKDNSAAAVAAAATSVHPFPTKSISTVVDAATCSYTVTIKTSCYSPPATHDAISLTFSDAYGNQVYAARLDDPYSGTFERCSTDTFLVQGPCGYKTCFLYMRRTGRDGWAPDWVKVVSPYTRQAVTFYYNGYTLPENVWYGFDLCSMSSGGGRAAAGRASWMVAVVVSVMLLLVLRPAGFFEGLDRF